LFVFQQIIKKEQGAINNEIKQRKKLEKVRNKAGDPHTVVSFHTQTKEFNLNWFTKEFNLNWFTNEFNLNWFTKEFNLNWFTKEFNLNWLTKEFSLNWFTKEFYLNWFKSRIQLLNTCSLSAILMVG